MQSKYDVLSHAKLLLQRASHTQQAAYLALDRVEIHKTQQKALNAVAAALPLEVGDKITLVSLGKIVRELSDAPEFHNIVQVYPVGYKCRMMMPNLRTLDHKLQSFEFEIIDVDGGPEFVATNSSNGQSVKGSTEEGLFKKLEAVAGYGGAVFGHKSVFNLEIELLLEGMDGVLECREYKFHEERGYPTLYTTQDSLVEARHALLANSARERRKARRDAVKLLSPEEQKHSEMLEKRRLQEEKESAKLEAAAERDRKKMEQAAFKAQKEKSAADAKMQRETAAKEKKTREEQQKKEDREKKELAKIEEK